MFRRPYLLGLLAVIAICSFLLARTASHEVIKPQSKRDHAQRLWSTSAHAQKGDEAFKHWDEEGQVPTTCAKCHSTPGLRDYLGADGTAPDTVDNAAPLGTTVECAACHSDPDKGVVHNRTYAIFPSGVKIEGLGPETLCMECHQGRASTKSVDTAIAGSGVTSDDEPSSRLRFVNVHYYAAAATQLGTVVRGGYQYAEKSYDSRFAHIPGYNACQVCHDPHSLEVDLDACNTCHTGVKNPKNIRYYGSWVDYDGDGNITEGIFYEIETIREILYNAMRAYARDVVGKPIAYDEIAYPYFFNDKNDNGVVDSNEAESSNGYSSFTARLLKAAYNLQVCIKDPCQYVHNGKYIIELLYDSIEDLNTSRGAEIATQTPVSKPSLTRPLRPGRRSKAGGQERTFPLPNDEILARSSLESAADAYLQYAPGSGRGLVRTDEGHFDGSAEAWRHWDGEGEVPSTCAKCHSAQGLPYLLDNGTIDKAMDISNGLLCLTCHIVPPQTRPAGPVTFPSGVSVNLADSSNLCLNCHQGRASKSSVDRAIAGGPGPYSFTNIHYYAAAASFFGSEVRGGYEFSGKTYAGRNIFTNHNGLFTNCVECHMGTKSFNRKHDDSDALFHNVQAPNPADCAPCHGQDIAQPHPGADPSQFEFEGIRPAQTPDYDGDGNKNESLQAEIKGLEDALYTQLQAYGRSIGAPIVYSEISYPYFFKDTDGDGIADPAELTSSNGYGFSAAMLKAAYNFQMSKKEPCGFIHNPLYIAQLLADSIGSLGGNMAKYTWR